MTVNRIAVMDDQIMRLFVVGGGGSGQMLPPSLECHEPQCIKVACSEDEVREAIEPPPQVNRGAGASPQGYVEDVMTGAR